MIEFAAKQGYEVTCNLMAISKCTMMQLSKALDALAQTPVMGVYIVDSYGALYPKEVRKLTRHFQDHLSPYGKLTGIHAHNNQQCAFANTIEAHDRMPRCWMPPIMAWDEVLATVTWRHCLAILTARSIMWSPCWTWWEVICWS